MIESKLIWIDSDEKVREIRHLKYFGTFIAITGCIVFIIIFLGVGLWYLSLLFLLLLFLGIREIKKGYPEPLEIYTDKFVYWQNITSSMENEVYKKNIVFFHDIEYIDDVRTKQTNIPIINEKPVKKWITIKLKNGKEIILSGRYVSQIMLAHLQLKKQFEYYQQYSR